MTLKGHVQYAWLEFCTHSREFVGRRGFPLSERSCLLFFFIISTLQRYICIFHCGLFHISANLSQYLILFIVLISVIIGYHPSSNSPLVAILLDFLCMPNSDLQNCRSNFSRSFVKEFLIGYSYIVCLFKHFNISKTGSPHFTPIST